MRAIRRINGSFLFGATLLLLLCALALFGDFIAGARGVDAQTIDLFMRLSPPGPDHPLGTDARGRDVLAQLLEGARISLSVAAAGALLAAAIGTMIGLVSGYLGGWVDGLLMRLTDGAIALPLLPLLIVLSAVDFEKLGLQSQWWDQSEGGGILRIVLIVALFGWTTSARLVRAGAMAAKRQSYVLSAVALGAGPWRIMFWHILPNAAQPLIVAAALSAGNIILLESALSFLGLGIQPPSASWGNMLSGALETIHEAPFLTLWPGAMIFAAVLGFNLIGDAFAQKLNFGGGRRA